MYIKNWSNGQPAIKVHYENENKKLDGEYIEYDKDGNIITQGNFVNGIRQGKWMIIYSNYYTDDYLKNEYANIVKEVSLYGYTIIKLNCNFIDGKIDGDVEIECKYKYKSYGLFDFDTDSNSDANVDAEENPIIITIKYVNGEMKKYGIFEILFCLSD